MKRNDRRFLVHVFRLVLLACLVWPALTALAGGSGGSHICKIYYGRQTEDGYVNKYASFNTEAVSGETIRTPRMEDRNERRCFWRAVYRGELIEIENGKKFTVQGNTRFYAYWRKLCKVRFFDQKGIKELDSIELELPRDEQFRPPVLKDTTSHYFAGWSLKKNDDKASYLHGRKYRLRKNLRLYAVYAEKPRGTVRLFSQAGGSEFNRLKIVKYYGENYKVPGLKDTQQYKFLGWSETPRSLSARYCTGREYSMNGSLKLYAVYVRKQDPYATFILTGGQVYKSCLVDGKTVRFPSVTFYDDRTCQGWSTKEGKTCDPEYLEDEVVPRRTATYYSVDAHNLGGKDDGGKVRETEKYTYAYFVGDSRIYLGAYYLYNEFSRTRLISRGGSGYGWLTGRNGGYERLLEQIRTDNKKKKGKKAVIFCSGVNDLHRADSYITFYKSKARQLKSLGCDLFVMSINPFNRSQQIYVQKNYNGNMLYREARTQALLKTFNSKLKKDLAGIYQYIDTYSYLVRTGWPTYNVYLYVPDGLHYTKPVTRRVFSYAARCIDKYAAGK